MQTMMKYNFAFFRTDSDGRLLLAANTLETIASSLVKYCQEQMKDLLQLSVNDCPDLRKLFADYLCNMKFSLIELRETAEGPVTEVHLMYKRAGWTMGPCAENNWERS